MKNEQNFEKFFVIRNSIQDEKLNSILDKISLGKKPNKVESKFLEKIEELLKYDLKDYSHLSKNVTVEVIRSLLSKKIKVICNLTDRDGKIDMEILSVENNFMEESCEIILKNKLKISLQDKFLYNLTYNIVKHEYSLTIQDEYFEKIFKEKDED